MKLSKAIELLEKFPVDLTLPPTFDLRTAVRMGREALKRTHRCRTTEKFSCYETLPGETEE